MYRVERIATGVVDAERRLVRAPFEARVETRRGEPDEVDPDADPLILDLEVLGGAETGPVDQERALVVVPPRSALRTGRLDTDLPAAAEAGVLEPLGLTRTIADRTCTELRTGAPLDGGVLQPPTADDHNDVCVDGQGLVLREEVTVDDAVTERRTAVQVVVDPVLDGDAFAPQGWRIPEGNGGGRVRAVTPDSRPAGAPHLQLPAPPAGMQLLGRFGVQTDAAPGPDPSGQTMDQIVSMVDVYVGGGGVLVIENGASVTGRPVLGRGDVDEPLAFAPDATAVFLTAGVELRAPLPTGSFVRITSTLPLADTVALADSMTTVDGPGEVVPLDEEPDITGRFERPS